MRKLFEEEKRLYEETQPWMKMINGVFTIDPKAPKEILEKYNLLYTKYMTKYKI